MTHDRFIVNISLSTEISMNFANEQLNRKKTENKYATDNCITPFKLHYYLIF